VLVESDDPLEAGLEIMCQPPGKKLSTLSLLSGGEQTLTALALIFAVFLANPAPICVLDEVDAPLDDANVTRFCDLLDEMTRRTETRFLIITHHAVTMARMDRLFGVTMAEQGVSQLVSYVDLKWQGRGAGQSRPRSSRVGQESAGSPSRFCSAAPPRGSWRRGCRRRRPHRARAPRAGAGVAWISSPDSAGVGLPALKTGAPSSRVAK
jgi:hypothetical protein